MKYCVLINWVLIGSLLKEKAHLKYSHVSLISQYAWWYRGILPTLLNWHEEHSKLNFAVWTDIQLSFSSLHLFFPPFLFTKRFCEINKQEDTNSNTVWAHTHTHTLIYLSAFMSMLLLVLFVKFFFFTLEIVQLLLLSPSSLTSPLTMLLSMLPPIPHRQNWYRPCSIQKHLSTLLGIRYHISMTHTERRIFLAPRQTFSMYNLFLLTRCCFSETENFDLVARLPSWSRERKWDIMQVRLRLKSLRFTWPRYNVCDEASVFHGSGDPAALFGKPLFEICVKSFSPSQNHLA